MKNLAISSLKSINAYSGEFHWDSYLQGQVLGAYLIGTLFTPIPFAILASRMHAAKWILGIGSLSSGILCLFTPVIARWSVYALITCRALQGLGAGVSYPSIHCLIGNWIPKNERSRVNAFIYNGIAVATVATFACSGPLMKSEFFGWPGVFYISGISMIVWFILWTFLVYESPNEHPRISQEELNYILGPQEHHADIAASSIPWKSILTSIPVWALVICHFCNNWSFYTMLTQLPTYLANVLFFNIVENGLLSSLPYIAGIVAATIGSVIADVMREKGLHITTIRKIMSSIALFIPGTLFILIYYVGCRPTAIIALLTIANAFNVFKYSGYLIINVDMTPKYAGIIQGFSGTFANAAGFLAPGFAGWATKTGHTLENWRIIFVTTAVLLIFGGIVFDVFSNATLQSWGGDSIRGRDRSETNTKENKEKE